MTSSLDFFAISMVCQYTYIYFSTKEPYVGMLVLLGKIIHLLLQFMSVFLEELTESIQENLREVVTAIVFHKLTVKTLPMFFGSK